MKLRLFNSFLLLFLIIGMVYAISLPAGFKGNIIIEDGKNADGQTLLASLNGNFISSYVISDGTYRIVVEDLIGSGGNVEFFIGDERAQETFIFDDSTVQHSDLTFSTVPDTSNNLEGNGVCDLGECSTFPVDCNLNECLDNGVCDVFVGEVCSSDPNSPNDCGVCPVDDGGSSSGGGGSSSGSSGGGSSGDGGFSNINVNTFIDNDDIGDYSELRNSPVPSIQSLNVQSSSKSEVEEKGFFSVITGGVIGTGSVIVDTLGEAGTVVTAIVLFAMLCGALFVVSKKKLESMG